MKGSLNNKATISNFQWGQLRSLQITQDTTQTFTQPIVQVVSLQSTKAFCEEIIYQCDRRTDMGVEHAEAVVIYYIHICTQMFVSKYRNKYNIECILTEYE